MLEENLKFSETPTCFLGRNGVFTCTGFTFYIYGKDCHGDPKQHSVWVSPITSKDEEGRCRIEIPMSQLDEFICRLKQAQFDYLKSFERA